MVVFSRGLPSGSGVKGGELTATAGAPAQENGCVPEDDDECIHGLTPPTGSICKSPAKPPGSSRPAPADRRAPSGRKTPENSTSYFGHPWPEWFAMRDAGAECIIASARRGETTTYHKLWSQIESVLGVSLGTSWRQMPNLLGASLAALGPACPDSTSPSSPTTNTVSCSRRSSSTRVQSSSPARGSSDSRRKSVRRRTRTRRLSGWPGRR
jgi:hypothetical protein